MFIDGRRSFERPSIPQTGWMGKVPLSLFEGNLFAPSASQSGLPRSYETVEDQTFCIQTQPVSAPLFYVAVFSSGDSGGGGGWWGPWLPGDWWGPWFPTSSFEPAVLPAFIQQLSSFNYETLDRFDLRDQPAGADLMYAPVFAGGGTGGPGGGWWGPWFPGDWWGPWFPSESPLFVAISDLERSFITDEELSDRHFILQTQPSFGWIFSVAPVTFDPAFLAAIKQLLSSFVAEPAFDHERPDQPVNVSQWKQVLDLWEAYLYPAVSDQSGSFRSNDEDTDRQFILQTLFESGWIVNTLPADPDVVSALSQLVNSFTAGDENTDRHFILQTVFDQNWLFLSAFPSFTWPALEQLLNSFRYEKLDDAPLSDTPVEVGRWQAVLGLWESYLSASINSQSQSYRSDAEQIDKTIETSFSTAWLSYITPPVPPDPALWPAIFSQTQMPEVRETTEEKSRHDQFSQGWIFYQVPVSQADTQHELLGAVATVSITINPQVAIPVDLNALFGFVTANDKLVCTNLTIEALN